MEPINDLFSMVHDFLLISLPKEQKCSPNTIRSYRKALDLFLDYLEMAKGVPFNRITFDDIDRGTLSAFLLYLEEERHCSVSTRNHRLHCIRAFFRYAAREDIANVKHFNEVQKVKSARQIKPLVEHMSETAVNAILQQPDTSTLIGKRDAFLMLLLYRTGVRVQELIDIKLCGQMKKKRPEKAQKCKRKFRKDEKSCKIGILQMKRPILQKAGDRGWKAKGSI